MEMTMKTEVDTAVTSTAPVDSEIDLNHLKLEPGLVQSVKSEPALLVKEEILDYGSCSQDGNEQQSVQGTSTPAGTGSVTEACSTSLGDLLNLKHEYEDMDIGPTVIQDMDIYYTMNKNRSAGTGENTIMDGCNETMPGSGVKKESPEDKLRVDKTIPCKYCGQKVTEDDNDVMHVKFCRGQQKDLKQHHLRQLRTNNSIGFKCDRTIPKPHLLSVNNKLKQRNCISSSSNQRRDETVEIKQKPDVCAKEYSSTGNCSQSHHLTIHSNHHSTKQPKAQTGEKPYRCNTCDKTFAQNSNLVQHMRVHTREKPYWCDTCDKRFSLRSNFMRHMRDHTREKPYRCDTCGKRFPQNSALTQHMKVHTREKLYQCKTCDKKFSQNDKLVRHLRVHTREKPYRCEICDKRFLYNNMLVRHIRVHTREKPYWCDMCDKRFSDKSTLARHMRVHTREKPYRCGTCDKRFSQNSNLVQHMRVHT